MRSKKGRDPWSRPTSFCRKASKNKREQTWTTRALRRISQSKSRKLFSKKGSKKPTQSSRECGERGWLLWRRTRNSSSWSRIKKSWSLNSKRSTQDKRASFSRTRYLSSNFKIWTKKIKFWSRRFNHLETSWQRPSRMLGRPRSSWMLNNNWWLFRPLLTNWRQVWLIKNRKQVNRKELQTERQASTTRSSSNWWQVSQEPVTSSKFWRKPWVIWRSKKMLLLMSSKLTQKSTLDKKGKKWILNEEVNNYSWASEKFRDSIISRNYSYLRLLMKFKK